LGLRGSTWRTTVKSAVLPNAGRAEIDPRKLYGYLLNTAHPVGRFKARFFASLGYVADEWQALEADLRIQHLSQPANPDPRRRHGQTWTIRAILKGPNGQSAGVVSVWFIPADRDVPHLVTAYPGDVL
jgi:hypothetical protein